MGMGWVDWNSRREEGENGKGGGFLFFCFVWLG